MVQTVVRVGHSYDGPQWTVSYMLKKPTLIPSIVIAAVKDNLIADLLLRKGPPAPGGAVQYEEQVVITSERGQEIIAEFGEIPTTQAGATLPMMAATQKRGLGLKVSKEMETRNDVGRVTEEISMAKDEMIRGWNQVFFAAVNNNANTLKMLASEAVSGDGWLTGGIRRDLADAMLLMANQQVQGARENDRYGFKPDTMVIHPTMGAEFVDNEEVNKVFENSPATTISPRFQLRHPTRFGQTLDVIESWEMNPDEVMLVQRKKFGFISDEWALNGSPMQYKASEETWSSYFTRRALVAIDRPKSVLIIRGVTGVAQA